MRRKSSSGLSVERENEEQLLRVSFRGRKKRENSSFCPILQFQPAAVNGAAGWPRCPAGEEAAKGEGILLRAE